MPREAAQFGGVPLNRDAGQTRGERTIWGMHSNVRRTPRPATLTAMCHDLPFGKRHYQHLTTTDKFKKITPAACMRLLLTMRNAIAKNGAKWNP